MFDEIVTKEGLKFNDLEKKIYKFVCMLGCFIIKYVLESRDRKLMKARDTKKFRHKGYKNNILTLETPSSSYHITHLITPPNKFKITIYYNL